MEKGRPYALRPEDVKRRLADELWRLCRDAGVKPVVIGGLAVNHHGYMRVTADVDVLVSREEAIPLYQRLKAEPGWKRQAEGFKNTLVGVGLDIYVEGEFPNPTELRTVDVRPLPVPSLPELIALKVMSGRARDDADVVELLKRHPTRMAAIRKTASRRLRTKEARIRLTALVARARAEAARRR